MARRLTAYGTEELAEIVSDERIEEAGFKSVIDWNQWQVKDANVSKGTWRALHGMKSQVRFLPTLFENFLEDWASGMRLKTSLLTHAHIHSIYITEENNPSLPKTKNKTTVKVYPLHIKTHFHKLNPTSGFCYPHQLFQS